MKATDLRNLTWAQVQEHIGDDMRRVHDAWQAHGPGTTRQVAERSGISLLTFRPRTTDLYKLGLVECVGCELNQGVYCYVPAERAESAEKWKQQPKGVTPTTAPVAVVSKPSRRTAAQATPSRDAVSHAASVLARARATRRGKASGQVSQFEITFA